MKRILLIAAALMLLLFTAACAEEAGTENGTEPKTSEYLSEEYDFHVVINNADWECSDDSNGIKFTDKNDSYETIQIVWISYDVGDAIDQISAEELVETVVGSWKEGYGEDKVTVLTDYQAQDVNGCEGCRQETAIDYLEVPMKATVVSWKAGTRVYVVQLVGVEDGFEKAESVLSGMLETFETAEQYHSRTGEV